MAKYGLRSGKAPQLVDRHDAGVLQLSGDLRLLDEPVGQLGLVAVLLEQDLDGQVAAEVDVAALEDGTHAASSDLAEELQVGRAVGQRGHLGRTGLDDRVEAGAALGLVQQHRGDATQRLGQGGQGIGGAAGRGIGRCEGDGPLGVSPLAVGGRPGQGGAHQAVGAEAARGVGRQRGGAIGAGAIRAHGRVSLGE
jgi:hypothetical protein